MVFYLFFSAQQGPAAHCLKPSEASASLSSIPISLVSPPIGTHASRPRPDSPAPLLLGAEDDGCRRGVSLLKKKEGIEGEGRCRKMGALREGEGEIKRGDRAGLSLA